MTAYPIGRIGDHTFAVSTPTALLSCSAALQCSAVSDKSGDLAVSPAGKWLGLQGRTIGSGATLYETSTWKMRTETGKIYPGDSDLAIEERGKLSIRHADGSLSVLAGIRPYWDRCCSYIGSNLLAVLSNELDAVLVFNSKGTELYRIAVSDRSHTRVIAACCGADRFAITESSYSFWNKLTNLLDVKHNRPFDVERVRIFAASTGHELSQVEFDPRVKLVPTALSPHGDSFAGFGRGQVRIWSVPESR